MSTRDDAIRLLRGHQASRINFSFPSSAAGTVTVNSYTFERVATAIENNIITVDDTVRLPADIGAVYVPDKIPGGEMLLRREIGRQHNGEVIHESVHASFDLTHSTLPRVDDETAAYIASALYWRMTGLRCSPNATIYRAASNVADSILHRRGIVADELNALRNRIRNHPVYRPYAGGTYLRNG
jgi:hypothetical protein